MAYYFAVETEKNSFNAINIKRCRHYFNTSNNYDEPLACTLKEINKVTTTFANEEELKQMLFKVYSIKEEELTKPIAIFYINEQERRLVKGNILYENSRDFLEEPSKIIEYIKKRIEDNDTDFFKSLINQLNDSFILQKINQIISSIEINQLNISNTKNTINEELIIKFVKLLIYDYHIENERIIKFNKSLNYEKLHTLVSFISNYELQLKNNYQKRKIKENTSN